MFFCILPQIPLPARFSTQINSKQLFIRPWYSRYSLESVLHQNYTVPGKSKYCPPHFIPFGKIRYSYSYYADLLFAPSSLPSSQELCFWNTGRQVSCFTRRLVMAMLKVFLSSIGVSPNNYGTTFFST